MIERQNARARERGSSLAESTIQPVVIPKQGRQFRECTPILADESFQGSRCAAGSFAA